MLSLHVDSSAMRLRHMKCLCDIGQNRCLHMRFKQSCSNGSMALSEFAQMGIFGFYAGNTVIRFAYNRLVQI